jgi:hypothetical protein
MIRANTGAAWRALAHRPAERHAQARYTVRQYSLGNPASRSVAAPQDRLAGGCDRRRCALRRGRTGGVYGAGCAHAMPSHRTLRNTARVALCALAVAGCGPSLSSRQAKVPLGAASGDAQLVGRTWNECTWLGPFTRRPGIFGSDLGFEVSAPAQGGVPEQLLLLFGDTWAEATDACKYPVLKQDDLVARVPRVRPESLTVGPPTAAARDACNVLEYALENPDDSTTWSRIHLFPEPRDHDPQRALDTGMNRTPLTAWSDGTHTFAYFYRDEYPRCDTTAQCPASMSCTHDPAYKGKNIGGCKPLLALTSDPAPAFCRDGDDCTAPAACASLDHGVCVANEPFAVQRDGQRLTPSWYTDDPRAGIAARMHIASAFWPDRPADFATGFRFVTNKYNNVTGRTVRHFDPAHPEKNDYSPGNETLLLWGRPGFVGHDGYQALPFLLYQSLAKLVDESGQINWAPHFFAGYDAAGKPAWSEAEADAQPVYGVDENLVRGSDGRWAWNWQSPEFDYVNQMSTTWLAPLQRWLLLYGGESPAEVDPGADARPKRTHRQTVPGAIHLRTALHPWGRAQAKDPAAQGFGPPRPVLTRAAVAHHLACADKSHRTTNECNPELPSKPGDLWNALGSAVSDFSFKDAPAASVKCAAGSMVLDAQYSGYDTGGHLYGAAIIQAWTQDVTRSLPKLPPGDRAVEIYWNVSTWNPYQVLLIKTQLRASEFKNIETRPN